MISYLQVRTGMRLGEVLLMKWKQNKKTDVGEKHSFSYVYLNPSKTKLTIHFKRNLRLIPIKNDIRDLLIKIQKDTKSKVYVFESVTTKTQFDNTSFSRPFKRLLNEMYTFVYINGRPNHMKGKHDDLIEFSKTEYFGYNISWLYRNTY